MNTDAETEHVREGKKEPIGKEACGNFLNHGDIPLHQS
jgi:hypothetical protein